MESRKIQRGDFRLVRNINDRLVLNLILEKGEISGAELSQRTGLRPSTISNILKGLQEKNLIEYRGKGDSTYKGGKRPFLWALNGKAAHAVGLDVEIGEIAVVIIDLNSKVILKKEYETQEIRDPGQLTVAIRECVEDAFKSVSIGLDNVLGMGVAFAGVVNREEGTILMTDVIPHLDFPLTESLRAQYGFPVIAENNANASAMESKLVGSAGGLNNLMTVLAKIDTHVSGMGIGLVLNGELYHGSTFCSGEITAPFPPMYNMMSRLREAFDDSTVLKEYRNRIKDLNIHVVIDAAKSGDKVAKRFFHILGQIIGREIAQYTALVNPEKVILAGDVAEVGDMILDPIKKMVELEVLSLGRQKLEIVTSPSGRFSVAMGAARIILDEFFKVPIIETNSISQLQSHL